jgi:RNA polymerase sigma-70 factor (ECF subfamily)
VSEKLAPLFVARLEWPTAPRWLEARLREIVERAARQWPAVKLDAARFIPYLAERLPAGDATADALAALHSTDLYLACACAHRDAAALRHLDEILTRAATSAAVPLDGRADLDELCQQLRERLLVAPVPRITQYSGTGPLAGWIYIAARRLVLTAHGAAARERRARVPGEARLLDPEIDLWRRKYGAPVEAALAHALKTLTPRDRHLLRLHYVEGLSLTRIARAHRVDRSTASRWVAAARELLLDETRRELAARLNLTASTVDSILRALRSQLDLSLSPLLRE